MRVESSVTSVSWIPSEAVTGAGAEGHVRVRASPATTIRRPTSSTTSRRGGPPGRFRFANRLHGLGRDRARPHRRRRLLRRRPDGRHDRAPGQAAGHVRAGPAPRPAPRRPSRTRHRGHVRADHRRSHRPARAAAGEAPAVPAVPRAHGVDHARAHHPRRRHVELRGARREQVPPPLGLRRRRARSRPRSGWPTSRSGTATRSASTRRGATQDSKALVTAVETALERQLSVTIMSGGERPEIRTLKEGEFLVQQGDPGDSLFLLLDGVLSVTIDGENGRRGGSGRRARRAGRARGRHPHRQPAGGDRRCGSRWRPPTASTARRCSRSREHHTPNAQ